MMVKAKIQKGFTLIEMAIVLIIMSILAASATLVAKNYADDTKAQSIADQLKTLTGGVSTMLVNEYATLADAIPNNTAGFAVEFAPTVAELKAKGYLANNFQNSSLAGNTWSVKISQSPVGCTPPACDLTALVYSSTGLTKDGVPDTMLAARISEKLGNDGGTSRDSAPNTISGPNGLWTTTNPLGAVQAVIAMQTGYGSQGFSQFVRMGDARAVTLNGGLTNNGTLTNNGALTNTGSLTNNGAASITGALAMNNQNITGVNALTATTGNFTNTTTTGTATMAAMNGNLQVTSVAVVGGACAPNARIAVDATGLLLSCQSGAWQKQQSNGPVTKGVFDILYTGACGVANPLTGACSCPSGSVTYLADVHYLNGFWSSAADYLYQCVQW
jgi:prepilin-type N-terminal cleavage/methylation domain-containing protein